MTGRPTVAVQNAPKLGALEQRAEALKQSLNSIYDDECKKRYLAVDNYRNEYSVENPCLSQIRLALFGKAWRLRPTKLGTVATRATNSNQRQPEAKLLSEQVRTDTQASLF